MWAIIELEIFYTFFDHSKWELQQPSMVEYIIVRFIEFYAFV